MRWSWQSEWDNQWIAYLCLSVFFLYSSSRKCLQAVSHTWLEEVTLNCHQALGLSIRNFCRKIIFQLVMNIAVLLALKGGMLRSMVNFWSLKRFYDCRNLKVILLNENQCKYEIIFFDNEVYPFQSSIEKNQEYKYFFVANFAFFLGVFFSL